LNSEHDPSASIEIAEIFQFGLKQHQAGKLLEASLVYKRILSDNPRHFDALHLLGAIEIQNKNFLLGIDLISEAISLYPKHASAFNNRGFAYYALNRINESISDYDSAIKLDANYADAIYNKGIAKLTLGEYETGWSFYESRWQRPNFISPKRNFPQPLWLGDSQLENKKILLHAEQGFGDTIQFCRYAKLVSGLGAKVYLEVPSLLLRLLKQLEGDFELVSQGSSLPDFDFHCPLMSLPLAFKTNLANVPLSTKYLSSETELQNIFFNMLGPKTRKRVGIAWSGRPTHGNDYKRSITLSQIVKVLPEGFDYISLQNEIRKDDVNTLQNFPIKHFGSDLKTFADTAALIELMDIVICVDTSVAHLAGALGKKTFLLLPFAPDWRWMLSREDSPWYESFRLFRQDSDCKWEPVIERLATELTR